MSILWLHKHGIADAMCVLIVICVSRTDHAAADALQPGICIAPGEEGEG